MPPKSETHLVPTRPHTNPQERTPDAAKENSAEARPQRYDQMQHSQGGRYESAKPPETVTKGRRLTNTDNIQIHAAPPQ